MLALYILLSLIIVGALLYLLDSHRGTHREPSANATSVEDSGAASPSECCGLHLNCEKALETEIVYYDDEELDAYRGRPSGEYTDAEQEAFRDVLLTLLPSDIAGWHRSLELRGIALPDAVRDEMLLLVAEARLSPSRSEIATPEAAL